jgi:hypothetical protein
MKIARGFKGNYFSLSAITATTSAVVLGAIHERITLFHRRQVCVSCEEDELDEFAEDMYRVVERGETIPQRGRDYYFPCVSPFTFFLDIICVCFCCGIRSSCAHF